MKTPLHECLYCDFQEPQKVLRELKTHMQKCHPFAIFVSMFAFFLTASYSLLIISIPPKGSQGPAQLSQPDKADRFAVEPIRFGCSPTTARSDWAECD